MTNDQSVDIRYFKCLTIVSGMLSHTKRSHDFIFEIFMILSIKKVEIIKIITHIPL